MGDDNCKLSLKNHFSWASWTRLKHQESTVDLYCIGKYIYMYRLQMSIYLTDSDNLDNFKCISFIVKFNDNYDLLAIIH